MDLQNWRNCGIKDCEWIKYSVNRGIKECREVGWKKGINDWKTTKLRFLYRIAFFNKNASLQIYKWSIPCSVNAYMMSSTVLSRKLIQRTLEASLEAQLLQNRVAHLIQKKRK